MSSLIKTSINQGLTSSFSGSTIFGGWNYQGYGILLTAALNKFSRQQTVKPLSLAAFKHL